MSQDDAGCGRSSIHFRVEAAAREGPGLRATCRIPEPSGLGKGCRGHRETSTHADLQVLQEVVQQAGTQAQCPCPLMAPWGLDPWPQVLGRAELHTGDSFGAAQEDRTLCT